MKREAIHRIFWICIALLIMAAIFYLSSQNAGESEDLSDAVAGVIKIQQKEDAVRVSNQNLFFGLTLRKFAHIFAFAALAFSLYYACFGIRRPFLPAFGIGILYAIADEIHQTFSGRHGRWQDVLIDAIGLMIGILTAFLVYRIMQAMKKRKRRFPDRTDQESAGKAGNDMNRILLISSRPLEHSGMTKIILDVIRFNRNRIAFDVACGMDSEPEYIAWLEYEGVRYIRLPEKKRVFSYMRGIRKTVAGNGYEKVYIHGNSALMILEALPAKLGKAEVVTHCHNTGMGLSLLHYLCKPLFNLVVDRKIGCSGRASAWAYCGKRIETIPNGIDPERFRPEPETREQIRKELGWEEQRIIGHIGTFNRQKNHRRLIEIFREAEAADPSVRLLMVGDGELREETAARIRKYGLGDKARIIDFTDRPQDYMQAMELMVLPSLFEGFCLVAVEAQACGVPVLASNALPEEAILPGYCRTLPLRTRNERWIRAVQEMIQTADRNGAEEEIRARGLVEQQMMERIQRVLCGTGEEAE